MMRAILLAMGLLAASVLCSVGCCNAAEGPSDATPYEGPTTPDTAALWWEFTAVVDSDLEAEREGRRPPGAWQTWKDRWLHSLEEIRRSRENPEKYVALHR